MVAPVTCSWSMAPAQPRSFFDYNYDIRCLIYEYFDDLPPVSAGQTVSGFARTCQMAKSEIEEFATNKATKHLQDFKTQYEAISGIAIGAPKISANSTFTQLRRVTITMPIEALFVKRFQGVPQQYFGYGWKSGTLQGLHLLLANPYDMIHVKFVGDPTLVHKTTSAQIAKSIYSALQDVQEVIDEANKDRGQVRPLPVGKPVTPSHPLYAYDNAAWDCEAQEAVDDYGDIGNYQNPWYASSPPPTTPIRTRRICFSWINHKSKPVHRATMLRGKLYWSNTTYLQLVGRGNIPVPRRPLLYYLNDANAIVAEMGIVSSTRWQGTEHLLCLEDFLPGKFDETIGVDDTPSDCEDHEVVDCCSDGIAQSLKVNNTLVI